MSSTIYPYHDKDLSSLPAPDVLEMVSYDALLKERAAAFNAESPLLLDGAGLPVAAVAELIESDTGNYWKIPADAAAGLYYVDLESDSAARILQADVYRELLLRQRVNNAALSTMPAYATGADLDNMGARYGVRRLIVTPATVSAAAVLESDAAYFRRMMLAVEGYARGGSVGWYLFNALSASPLVKDARIISPRPCEIEIIILSREGSGVASAELLATVETYIKTSKTRVLGDQVSVIGAEIISYSLSAAAELYPGPADSAVSLSIKSAFDDFRVQSERIGHDVTMSGIMAALHQPGVYRARVNNQDLPLLVTEYQASYCEGFDIVVGAINE